MRILKGQEILPDDSTLVQHNISDGDTVNILIEPEQEIEVEVQCGAKIYKHKINHCMTVKQLKMMLITTKKVAFLHPQFDLVIKASNGEIEQDEVLDDEAMPLHYFTLGTSVKMATVSTMMLVKSQNQFGEIAYHKITNKSTASDLEGIIMKSGCFDLGVSKPLQYGYKSELEITESVRKDLIDISMFVSDGHGGYVSLDELDTVPVCKLLPEDKIILP